MRGPPPAPSRKAKRHLDLARRGRVLADAEPEAAGTAHGDLLLLLGSHLGADRRGALVGRGGGVHVDDAAAYDSMHTATAMICAARTFAGFDWRRTTYEYVSDRLAIDLLYGDDVTRKNIEAGADATAATAHHEAQRQAFIEARRGVLYAGYGAP